MLNIPKDRMYTKTHEWAKTSAEDPNTVTLGITEHAQEALGDIVFVELPEVGTTYQAGDDFGVVESVKAVSDLYIPCEGEIVAINERLEDEPELINQSSYEDGWLIKIKVASQE